MPLRKQSITVPPKRQSLTVDDLRGALAGLNGDMLVYVSLELDRPLLKPMATITDVCETTRGTKEYISIEVGKSFKWGRR